MKIGDVMEKRVVRLKPNYSLTMAAKILIKHDISGAPVVDEQDKILGILAETDIFRALNPTYKDYLGSGGDINYEDMENRTIKLKKKLVKDYMNKDVLIVKPETPVLRAGSLMLAKGYNRIPVGKNKKLVGMVSRREIYHNLFKKQLGL